MKITKLVKKSKFKQFLENIFSPKSPIDFVGFVVFAWIMSLVTTGSIIGLIAVIIIALIWILVIKEKPIDPHDLRVNIKPEKPEGAVGLILLLSPYNNQEFQGTKEEIKQLINSLIDTPIENLTEDAFEVIKIGSEKSNLRPQLKAVQYHIEQGKLEQVWLMSTPNEMINGRVVEGSELTAKLLEKYLNFRYGGRLKVEREGYTVEDGNYGKLYYVIDQIFKTSKYKESEIIADITGGKKMMSVALAMACVAPERKMQYMDSDRDWRGNPLEAGNIQPVEIDVDPIFHQGKENL
jgi:hypothetical protein